MTTHVFIERYWPLLAIAAAALVTNAVAIWQPYLFMDESWFIRSMPHSFDNLGRPIIGFLFRITIKLWIFAGLHAITISRIIGTVFLCFSGFMTYYWLRSFLYDRVSSTAISVGLLSLPGMQILSATVFQIQFGVVAAFGAGLCLLPFLRGASSLSRSGPWLLASVALAVVAICTYQSAINIIACMLLLPLLSARKEDRTLLFKIAASYVALFIVVVIYYISWRSTFETSGNAGMDNAYGPGGASISQLLEQVKALPFERFIQVANLWYVDSLSWSLFFYLSVGIVVIAIGKIVIREAGFGALKSFALVAAVPLSDIFRLVSTKGPTYTSAHAVTAAWWFIFAWAIVYVFGRHAVKVLVPLVVLGVVWATWTTGRLAGRNGAEFDTLVANLVQSPGARHVHVIGMQGNYPEYREYGWTTAQSGFLMSMTETIALGLEHPVAQLGYSNEKGSPLTPANPCGRPDMVIRLPSEIHRCEGLGCRLTEEETDKMTWPAC